MDPSLPTNLPKATQIIDITQDNYRTKTFQLDCSVDAVPGQFVMVWLPRFDEKPFSLVNNDPVTLMITSVGPFSQLMHEKEVGDQIWFRGPFGRGFSLSEAQRGHDERAEGQVAQLAGNIALVGGGYGVAPLYWLAQAAGGTMSSVTSILGARTANDVLYAERFSGLSSSQMPTNAETEHQLLVTTEDGTAGTQGRVTDVLLPQLEAGKVDAIFACGPDGMLAALEELARTHNVPAQLSWEAYMRCAIGICGACDHHGKVLCMDGPVLSVL